jgi:hypothetical protein
LEGGGAEVGELQFEVAGDQDVGRLYVAMNDAEVVEVGERLGELAAPGNGLTDGHANAVVAGPSLKTPAVGVVQHHVWLAVSFTDVAAALQVGIDESLGKVNFTSPPRREHGMVEHSGVGELEHNLVTGAGVLGAMDLGLGAVGEVLD